MLNDFKVLHTDHTWTITVLNDFKVLHTDHTWTITVLNDFKVLHTDHTWTIPEYRHTWKSTMGCKHVNICSVGN